MSLLYKRQSQSGFALVIALSLMAFILLLLLSITTLVQVESKSASISKGNLLARQNAMLGFYQALGTLQQATGEDQRVTATAAVLDTDPTTESADGVVLEQTNWTGVWDTTDTTIPPQWLVSGDPASIDPTTSAPNPETLVSLAEAGDLAANVVRAPSVEISGQGATVGSFAWWIGDEGVKARYNMPREPSSGMSNQELLWRASLPTSYGINYLDADSTNGVRNFFEPENSNLVRSSSFGSAALSQTTTPALTALPVLQKFFHDVTFHSSSVLSNTVDGGLRKDLSRGLYDESNKLTGLLFPENSAINALKWDATSPSIVPTWELLQSYAQYIAGDGDLNSMPSIAPRLHSNAQYPHITGVTQQGVSPLIVRATLSLYAKLELDSGTWGAAGSTYKLALAIEPVFILHNPYNVRLEAANYRLSIKALSRGASFFTDPANVRFFDRGWLRNNLPGTAKWKQDYNFLAPGISFEPGQFKVLSIPAVDPGDPYSLYDEFEIGDAYAATQVLEGGDQFGRLRLDVRWIYSSSTWPDNVPFTFEDLDAADLKFIPANITSSGYGNAHGATLKFASAEDLFQSTENHFPLARINRVGGGWWGDKSLPSLTNQVDGSPPGAQDYEFVFSTDIFPANDYPDPTLTDYYYHRDTYRLTNPRFNYSANAADFSGGGFNERNEATYQNGMFGAELGRGDPFGRIELNTNFDQAYGGPSAIRLEGAVPAAVSYEIPVQPLQSIAQLQHVDLFFRNAKVGSSKAGNMQPGYGIGHSFHDHNATNATLNVFGDAKDKEVNDLSDAPTDLDNIEADVIYQANQALWDDYFFSTLRSAQMATVASDSTLADLLAGRLQNSRIRAASPESIDTTVFDDKIMDMNLAASHLLIDGALNINSTSVAAWRAFLSSMLGQDSLIADGSPAAFDNNELFFSRTTLPNAEPVDSTISGFDDDYWKGSVSLNEDQVDDLAKAIVQRIKAHFQTYDRPFFSIAEFVNRQADDQEGLLQQSIEDAGINDEFLAAYTRVEGQAASTQYAPGFVSQADLLQPLGPFLTARSDTFRIRAKGYSEDPITGEINGSAVCEAIIQRSPQAIAGTDRLYEIVDFRWIDPALN